ncbi:hypothetical protein [Pelagibacterium xiamenense]|uniref:hypothetical protein n=1 Tax=Pelagibacterium xiamenense TaxID=2901140 RepID=UPI001E619948|nr:hypothetical protein [Pelagibacterium xiamenense]MCD7058291.1 hypothetical protein [Pelagibacterium xiamenense]
MQSRKAIDSSARVRHLLPRADFPERAKMGRRTTRSPMPLTGAKTPVTMPFGMKTTTKTA